MNEESKHKGGRKPVPIEKHFKRIHVSISPAAFKRYQQIPSNERSRRISKFLERCEPDLIQRDHGERTS